MTERQDLKARAFVFATKIFDLYPDIVKVNSAFAHIGHQLFRAATGIGALLEEGVVANSRRDMASKYAIALREARESNYWLRLLGTRPDWTDRVAPHVDESGQFVRMLTVSVRKLRNPTA